MEEILEENIQDVELESKGGFIVDAGILHILDYNSHHTIYSESTLNLEDSFLKKLSKRLVRKCHSSVDATTCKMSNQQVLSLIHGYSHNEINFVDMSTGLVEVLDKAIGNESIKALCAFVFSYHYEDVPYVVIMLLEGQSGFLAFTDTINTKLTNTIKQNPSVMPNFSKKIPSFIIMNALSEKCLFVDHMKWNLKSYKGLTDIFGIEKVKQSEAEVYETLVDVVKEVQANYPETSINTPAKLKQKLSSSMQEESSVITDDLAKVLFPTNTQQEYFKTKVKEQKLPEEITLTHSSFNKKLESQRIKTDTGITISYPIEFATNPEMISFEKEEDGSISITIRHIRSIENK